VKRLPEEYGLGAMCERDGFVKSHTHTHSLAAFGAGDGLLFASTPLKAVFLSRVPADMADGLLLSLVAPFGNVTHVARNLTKVCRREYHLLG